MSAASARIPARPGQALALTTRLQELPVDRLAGPDGRPVDLSTILAATSTDAWIVLHDGVVVDERYPRGWETGALHPLLSITKTVVGAVTGILIGQGRLDPRAPVAAYLPELAGSGYGGATLRDVLDMRSGVRFDEDYANPNSDVNRMGATPAGWQSFLREVVADRPHGGPFEYRSVETEVLGWACERASGSAMPQLISELIWQPMGAENDAALLLDPVGAPIHDGGMLATARDVARFGQLLLAGGAASRTQVIPRDWIAQIWAIDPDLRAAFHGSPAGPAMPGGWYRSQCWLLPGPHGDLLLALGIHGQLLRVDPATRTVMVKLSSWPHAQDPASLHATLRGCDAVAAALSGRPIGAGPRFTTPTSSGMGPALGSADSR